MLQIIDGKECCVSNTPTHTCMECIDWINALYQVGYINSETKNSMAELAQKGIRSGDFTDFRAKAISLKPHMLPENKLYEEIEKILN